MSGSYSVVASIDVEINGPGEYDRLINYINNDNLKVKETLSKAQQSKKDAMANELASVNSKIASAVLNGEYQISFSPVWNDTEDKLKEAGYKVFRDPRYNDQGIRPTLTVSWS